MSTQKVRTVSPAGAMPIWNNQLPRFERPRVAGGQAVGRANVPAFQEPVKTLERLDEMNPGALTQVTLHDWKSQLPTHWLSNTCLPLAT